MLSVKGDICAASAELDKQLISPGSWLNLGIRAHDLGTGSAKELSARAVEFGLKNVQLAPLKALTDIPSGGPWQTDFAHCTALAFAKVGIRISVLGCYINPVHPDMAERTRALERFKEALRYSRDFGAGVVGTETGSLNADCSLHADNQSERAYQSLRASVSDLLDEAEKLGVTIALEAAKNHIIGDACRMRRLLDDLGSKRLQVIYDPVNILATEPSSDLCRENDDALALLGPHLAAVHAKDFLIQADGSKRIVAPGKGVMEYAHLLQAIRKLSPGIPVILEGCSGEAIRPAIEYLQGTGITK